MINRDGSVKTVEVKEHEKWQKIDMFGGPNNVFVDGKRE